MSPLLGKISQESFIWRESVPVARARDLRELEILRMRVVPLPGLGPPLLVSQVNVLETVRHGGAGMGQGGVITQGRRGTCWRQRPEHENCL